MENFARTKTAMICINACHTLLSAFFSIFFSVYILQNINDDIVFVLIVNLAATGVAFLFHFVFYYLLNQKTIMLIYRLSFLMYLLIMVLVVTLPTGLYLPFLILALQRCTAYFYYTPHEIAIMDKNKARETSGFLAKSAVIAGLAAIVAPFLVGVIISEVNFFAMFVTLGVLCALAFVFSLMIPRITIAESPQKFSPMVFVKKSLKYKHMRSFYLQHFFTKTSTEGAVSLLLPILIFFHAGESEFSLGLYSSLVALFALGALIVYSKLKKWQLIIILVTSILWLVSALSMTLWLTLASVLVFSALGSVSNKVFGNARGTILNNSIKIEELAPYKREFHFAYNVLKRVSVAMTMGISLLLCMYFEPLTVIPIIIAVLTGTYSLSLLFYFRAKKQLSELEL
ncbi:MAG: hypothetical protein FWC00_04885 [Firmicutes bacterium]|nr:hypothetical protein [Bacillota bacterium]